MKLSPRNKVAALHRDRTRSPPPRWSLDLTAECVAWHSLDRSSARREALHYTRCGTNLVTEKTSRSSFGVFVFSRIVVSNPGEANLKHIGARSRGISSPLRSLRAITNGWFLEQRLKLTLSCSPFMCRGESTKPGAFVVLKSPPVLGEKLREWADVSVVVVL